MASFQSPGKNNSSISGTTLSSWSRQQKIAMIAGFVILGVLIALSACSKQASKSALVSIPNDADSPAAVPASAATTSTTPAAPVVQKKTKKHPAAIVTYSDPASGVSFRYPRKYALASGEQAETRGLATVKMNFVQPGGAEIASVEMPAKSYPGTDFNAAFFNINVNRTLSEQECSQFAFVDTQNADGEAVDPEKVDVGSNQLSKTTDFSGDGLAQAETQYYHRYESGACYEFVLGLNTAGLGTRDSIESVNRDDVFARLKKILASVKIQPADAEQPQVAATTTPGEITK